jgi:hypothetical protein
LTLKIIGVFKEDINKQINELKKTLQDMKKKFSKEIEILKKK